MRLKPPAVTGDFAAGDKRHDQSFVVWAFAEISDCLLAKPRIDTFAH